MNTPNDVNNSTTVEINGDKSLIKKLDNQWFQDIAILQNDIFFLTHKFYQKLGFKTLNLSLIVEAPSCPTDSTGSDSKPMTVYFQKNSKYLSDSSQFFLEYSTRLFGKNCYSLLPSFRDEKKDKRHLSEFYHSEAEIIGDMENAISIAEQYINYLSKHLLKRNEEIIMKYAGTRKHIKQLDKPIKKLTFDEAFEIVGKEHYEYLEEGNRRLTPSGELFLLNKFNGVVWITEPDSLSVPFFQAFLKSRPKKSKAADLLMGIGETIGLGERHFSDDDVINALDLHQININEYQWYIDLKKTKPLKTAGFGMGVERYLCWLLRHDDIRDFIY